MKQLLLVIVETNQMGGVSVQRQLQGKLAISRYSKVLAGQSILQYGKFKVLEAAVVYRGWKPTADLAPDTEGNRVN